MLRKNFKYLIGDRSPNEVANAIKPNYQPNIFRIIEGEVREPRDSTIKPFADYFGVSLHDLKYTDLEKKQIPAIGNDLPKPSLDEYLIPRFDTGGKMGETGLVLTGWTGAIENLKVDAEWLRNNLKGYTSTKNLGVVTGFGESMEPLFRAGDPLIIDTSIKEHIGDFPYFFRVGNEGYIKRLQKVPGKYVALSANKEYVPFNITPDMDFAILGKVIKAWCSEDF